MCFPLCTDSAFREKWKAIKTVPFMVLFYIYIYIAALQFDFTTLTILSVINSLPTSACLLMLYLGKLFAIRLQINSFNNEEVQAVGINIFSEQ